MTYLAAQADYRAVPLTAIVRHPGTFGLTVTLVSVPAAHVLAPFVMPDTDWHLCPSCWHEDGVARHTMSNGSCPDHGPHA